MDYCKLAEEIFSLINKELESVESKKTDLAEAYPKLVICVEFFRYLRGEFFHTSRSQALDCQKKMYEFEDRLTKKLTELKMKINFTDQKTEYNLNLNKKLFEK